MIIYNNDEHQQPKQRNLIIIYFKYDELNVLSERNQAGVADKHRQSSFKAASILYRVSRGGNIKVVKSHEIGLEK